MTDPTEDIRKPDARRDQRCPRLQGVPGGQARASLGHRTAIRGLEVMGFAAPLVVVRRKSDGQKGA